MGDKVEVDAAVHAQLVENANLASEHARAAATHMGEASRWKQQLDDHKEALGLVMLEKHALEAKLAQAGEDNLTLIREAATLRDKLGACARDKVALEDNVAALRAERDGLRAEVAKLKKS